MASENVRFCWSLFLPLFQENGSSYQKGGFSYRVDYLIDKKGYRKSIFLKEKDCRLKKNIYFCAVKMAKKTNVFVGHFIFLLYLNHNQVFKCSESIKNRVKCSYYILMYACTYIYTKQKIPNKIYCFYLFVPTG